MAGGYHSKNGTPLEDSGRGRGSAEQQKVIRTPASALQIEKPAGAASSVFDIAKPEPKPRKPREADTTDLASLVVHPDRPIPPARTGKAASGNTYAHTYERMGPGGSIDVNKRQMFAFRSWAKRKGVQIIVRQMEGGMWGVWRPKVDQEATE